MPTSHKSSTGKRLLRSSKRKKHGSVYVWQLYRDRWQREQFSYKKRQKEWENEKELED